MNENEIRSRYEAITKTLIRRGLTITTMESCTSGQLASLLTDTEGASAVLRGAYVTYSNEGKIMQGVPAETIERCGVYSAETAKAMATACRKSYRANIGVGITGTFGNLDPANPDSVTGQVYFAVDFDGCVTVYDRKVPVQPSRYAYKMAMAKEVADVLLDLLG